MKYSIYFHHYIEELDEIDDDEKLTGNTLMYPEQYELLIDKDITFKLIGEPTKISFLDFARTFAFECWLDFYAESDDDAIKKAEKVLDEKGFDWVDIYYILQTEKLERVVLDHTGIN